MILRYVIYFCLRNYRYKNIMVVALGPRITELTRNGSHITKP